MSAFHLIYGLRLAANIALPGLPLQQNSEPPDARIQLKDARAFPSSFPFGEDFCDSGGHPDGLPNLRAGLFSGGQYFGLLYGDGARFAVERNGCQVWADWPENYTLEDACTYLLGPVMGFLLRLRGVTCLHASAVAIGDCAIALVGSPGAGKSTTAAAFARSGFAVLADDVVALRGHHEPFLVQPGYPRLNLWPDSVRALFGSEEALPRITPTWHKRYMPLGKNGHRFASEPLPLAAIYIFGARESALTAPVLEEITGTEAFVSLVANSYVNYLLDREMRRQEFDVLSRLAARTPIRRVRPPANPSLLPSLCQAIATDTQTLLTRRLSPSAPSVH